jgi:AcrR family transcriptional regulator
VRISGYQAATVATIAAQADLPEEVFHDHFRNKEDAFLCAYDHWVSQLASATTEICNGADTSRGAVREILAFLSGLADTQPDLCYLATAEIFALGATGHARRAQTFSHFESQLRSTFGNQEHICGIASTAVLGSVSQVIAQAVMSGNNHDLTRQLEFLVLTPLEAAG